MIAYMITWTTYGSWLQGDKRGYVKNGQILGGNGNLKSANQNQQKSSSVKLNDTQKQIVKNSIEREAERVGQKIYALAVCSNHIHLVLHKTNEPIENAVRRYKYSATKSLRHSGLKGDIWTKGFDKRFYFNEYEIEQKIRYVQKHDVSS